MLPPTSSGPSWGGAPELLSLIPPVRGLAHAPGPGVPEGCSALTSRVRQTSLPVPEGHFKPLWWPPLAHGIEEDPCFLGAQLAGSSSH